MVYKEINISNRVLRQCPRYTRRLIYLTEFLDSVQGIHGD